MMVPFLLDFPQILRHPWWKRERLEGLQQEKLRRLVRHAYENVPYYRDLFDSVGVKPMDIRTCGDLALIPITTRAAFQSRPIHEIAARNVNLSRCLHTRTSGSQGIPLSIYHRQEDKHLLDLFWARAKLADGQRLRDRVVSIRESTYHPPSPRWFHSFGIWRTTPVSESLDLEEQLKWLEKVNPQILSGFPSSLKLLSRGLQGRKNRILKLRAVFTMAELLDVPSRNLISSAFEAPVFDFYGSAELGLVGWECPARTGYHINIDSVLVEFLWEDKPVSPGQEGKLVCTALHSYAMPFIRYEIGDVGVEWNEPCPCGRGLPMMKMIHGRFNDFIVLKDGRRISPFRLTCSVESVPGIGRYQIIQEKTDRTVIRLVRGKEFSQAVFEEIRQRLRPLWGEEMGVFFEILEDIPKNHSKFQVVSSKVRDG